MWTKPQYTYTTTGNLVEKFYDASICVPGERDCMTFPTFVRSSPQCGNGRIVVAERIHGDLAFGAFNTKTNRIDLLLPNAHTALQQSGIVLIDGDKIAKIDKELAIEKKREMEIAKDRFNRYKQILQYEGATSSSTSKGKDKDKNNNDNDTGDSKDNDNDTGDNNDKDKDMGDNKNKNKTLLLDDPTKPPPIPTNMKDTLFYCVDPNTISSASRDPSYYRPKPHKWQETEYYCPPNEMGYKGYCLSKFYYDDNQYDACDKGSLADGCRNFQTVAAPQDDNPYSEKSKYAVQAKTVRNSTYQYTKKHVECTSVVDKKCVESKETTYYCPGPNHTLEMNNDKHMMYCIENYSRAATVDAQEQNYGGLWPLPDATTGKVYYCPNPDDMLLDKKQGPKQCVYPREYDKYMNAFPMNRCQKSYNTDCMLGHTLVTKKDNVSVDWEKISTDNNKQ